MAAEPEPGHLAASWRPPWPLPIGAAGGWPARRCWKTSSSRQSSWAGARCSSCSSQRAFTPTCARSQVSRARGLGRGGPCGGSVWRGRDGGTDLAGDTTLLLGPSAKGLSDPHPALLGAYHGPRFMDESWDWPKATQLGAGMESEPLSPGHSLRPWEHCRAPLLPGPGTCHALHEACFSLTVEKGTPDSVAWGVREREEVAWLPSGGRFI